MCSYFTLKQLTELVGGALDLRILCGAGNEEPANALLLVVLEVEVHGVVRIPVEVLAAGGPVHEGPPVSRGTSDGH